jgi:hypothetical protein
MNIEECRMKNDRWKMNKLAHTELNTIIVKSKIVPQGRKTGN